MALFHLRYKLIKQCYQCFYTCQASAVKLCIALFLLRPYS